jgi:ABC-type multidrug transport system fused ATPase/permease subunit
MNLDFTQTAVLELVARFAIDVAAMVALVFGMYYRRYRDKELVTAAALFNVFAFAVLTILSNVQFSVAAGFGLFAILALFSLRSEQISKTEITYFFGSIAIAVICSVQGTTIAFVAAVVTLILIAAWIIDHPRILRSADGVKITLDKIDAHALSKPEIMRADLSARLGVEVMSYQIVALDYINDMARINVFYRKH